MNARVHSLVSRSPNASLRTLSAYPRSGAFATHGRHPKGRGLATLTAAHAAAVLVRAPLCTNTPLSPAHP